MAKTVALDEASLRWARERFREYYAAAPIEAPPRLTRREFAAFTFSNDALMRRHASFATYEEFRGYLAREAPRHVYYSSAYYRKPDEPTMAQKDWLGADLIFDLDADHLRGADRLDYPGQLARVKEKLRQLVDDFLLRDFGVDPRSMALVFSGGRGYHVHVREDRFLTMTSAERRELVEYLSGAGFDPASVVSRRRERGWTGVADAEGPSEGRGRSGIAVRHLSSPEAPGWAGRTTRAVLELLDRWERGGVEGATTEIESMGFPHGKARRWATELVSKGGARSIREDPNLTLPPHLLPEELLEEILKRAEIVVQGETDAPVTTDVHRLIRLPGSLHGGSGLRVVPLSLETLGAFDPFRDAFPAPLDSTRTEVVLAQEVDYPFSPEPLRAPEGDHRTVSTATALFLVLRGEARLPPSPS